MKTTSLRLNSAATASSAGDERVRNSFSARVEARRARITTLAASASTEDRRELFIELSGLAATASALGFGRISELAARASDRCSEAVRKGVGSAAVELRLLIAALDEELVAIRSGGRVAA